MTSRSDPLKRLQASPSLRQALRIGGDIAQIAVHLTSNTTSIGKVGAIMGVANALLGKPKRLAAKFDHLQILDLPRCLQTALFVAMIQGNKLTPGAEDGKEKIWSLVDEGGGAIHWVRKDGPRPDGPWLDQVDEDRARAMIGRAIWETLGTKIDISFARWGEEASLSRDELSAVLPSSTSAEIAETVSKYLGRGKHRSYLLHGPSGTGKSFILRDVSRRLGGLCLRASNVGYGTDKPLQEIVRILRPSSLIVDDICRENTTPMLDAMERLKAIVPFIGASANYTGKMDPAIRRPGRFDRSVFLDTLDDETFSAMTGHLSAPELAKIRGLPAAYIAEFVDTAEVEGLEVAKALVPSLIALADEIEKADAPGKPAADSSV